MWNTTFLLFSQCPSPLAGKWDVGSRSTTATHWLGNQVTASWVVVSEVSEGHPAKSLQPWDGVQIQHSLFSVLKPVPLSISHSDLRMREQSGHEGNRHTAKPSSVFFSTLTHHLGQGPKANLLQFPHLISNLHRKSTNHCWSGTELITLWSGVYPGPISSSQAGSIWYKYNYTEAILKNGGYRSVLRKPCFSLGSDIA